MNSLRSRTLPSRTAPVRVALLATAVAAGLGMMSTQTGVAKPMSPSDSTRTATAAIDESSGADTGAVLPDGTSDFYPTADNAAAATTAASSSTSAPSASATAGWVQTFRDDFNGSSLNSGTWSVYSGGGKLNAAKENTRVSGGVLTLRTTKVNGVWRGAGVSSSRGFWQKYGKFEVRMKLDRAQGTRAVALLWPKGGGWPPEVDFAEFSGADKNRTVNHLTNHYRPGNQMDHADYGADFTQWHTVGVEWTPSALVYTLDGVEKARMTSHIPDVAMWMGMQTRSGMLDHAKPDSSTPSAVDFDIDWVAAYRKA